MGHAFFLVKPKEQLTVDFADMDTVYILQRKQRVRQTHLAVYIRHVHCARADLQGIGNVVGKCPFVDTPITISPGFLEDKKRAEVRALFERAVVSRTNHRHLVSLYAPILKSPDL